MAPVARVTIFSAQTQTLVLNDASTSSKRSRIFDKKRTSVDLILYIHLMKLRK
jgi:hypothetical protein